MKLKDSVLNFILSILIMVFGVLLLLDQLNIKYIDDFFTPWYLILILYFAASLLAIAIVKKSPITYVLAMLMAGIYLLIALPNKIEGLSVWKILFILPLFIGLGVIIGDLTCKWSPKALRAGLTITICSAIILVSSILGVWQTVIPAVVITYGLGWMIFILIDFKKSATNDSEDESRYVTPSKDKYKDKDEDNN